MEVWGRLGQRSLPQWRQETEVQSRCGGEGKALSAERSENQ